MLERFRRPIDQEKHVREIDGLRLLAVMSVVVAHITPSVAKHYQDVTGISGGLLGRLTSEGGRGVTLFFVISGFVLSLPFLRARAEGGSPVSVRRYFARRLRRIEPPYVLSLALFLVGDIVLLRTPLRSLLPHFLAGLAYGHGLVFGVPNPINSVTWSLEVEAQFYLVMPLIASVFLLTAPRRRALLLGLGVLSLATLAGPLGDSLRWTRSLAGSLPAFAVGIVIADLYLHQGWAGRAGSRRGDVTFAVGLGSFITLPVVATGAVYASGQVLASGLLVVGALRSSAPRRALRRPTAWIVGGMCYSIYLVHLQVIRLLWRPMHHVVFLGVAGFGKTLMVQLLVMLPVVLLLSGTFYVLVEQPFMRWARRAPRSSGEREDEIVRNDQASIAAITAARASPAAPKRTVRPICWSMCAIGGPM